MKAIKQFGIKLASILVMASLFLVLGALFMFGVAWLAQFVALDSIIEAGLVSDISEFWDYTLIFYVLIIIPPIYMLVFRAFPASLQNDITQSVSGIALAALYLGDWVGKGILLAFGAYLFYIAFAL